MSWVTSSSPTMTSTDSGLSSRLRSSASTVIGPATSTSRRGFRSSTFIAAGYRYHQFLLWPLSLRRATSPAEARVSAGLRPVADGTCARPRDRGAIDPSAGGRWRPRRRTTTRAPLLVIPRRNAVDANRADSERRPRRRARAIRCAGPRRWCCACDRGGVRRGTRTRRVPHPSPRVRGGSTAGRRRPEHRPHRGSPRAWPRCRRG